MTGQQTALLDSCIRPYHALFATLPCSAPCRTETATRTRSYYRTCKRRELIQALKREGFYLARSGGPHDVFVHGECGGNIPVPRHARDIPNGTLASILRAVKSISGEDLEV
jgi:predicted RNA binding protein YcfA (HicA-like mRNA interferase family)